MKASTCTCLLTVLLFSLPAALGQQAASETELASINAAITAAQSMLAVTRQAHSSLGTDIEASEREVQKVQQVISQLQEELRLNQGKLTQLQSESTALEQAKAGQQTLIAAYLEQAWKQGDQPRLKLLLNQEDVQLASRMLHYHEYLTQARAELVDEYTATLTRFAATQTEIGTTVLALEGQQQQLALQQESLQEAQQERLLALASLDADLKNRSAALDELQMQKVEIEVLLEELRRSVNELALEGTDDPFAARKGKLPWPVKGRVVQDFGSRHELGDLTWEGMTIAAPAGTDIVAIHHGRVIFADWFGNSGLLLIIDHGDGYMSLYAHNKELYQAVGQWVSSGEIIAAVGDTGGQREAGLYFEVRLNGTAQNPGSWLSASN